eukprot:764673-Hanusia_phi.AAC.2
MEGDRRVAAERMEAEGAMEPKEELQRARAAYFTALETGEEVTWSSSPFPLTVYDPSGHSCSAVLFRWICALVFDSLARNFASCTILDVQITPTVRLMQRFQLNNKKFTYAWCLIYMKDHEEIRTGITLLQELTEIKSLQREAFYYLAVAQFVAILLCLGCATTLSPVQLLAIDPNNRPALDLKALVEHVLRKEGAIGLAVFSGGVAAAAGVALAVGAALAKRR